MLSSDAEKKKRYSETYVLNKKYLGEEPAYEVGYALSSMELLKAYNWFHYMCDVEDAREFLFSYAKYGGYDKEVVQAVRDIDDNDLPLTLAWVARILSRGGVLPETTQEKLVSCLKNMPEFVKTRKEEKKDLTPKRTINIQDNIRSKVSEFVSDLHYLFDKKEYNTDVYTLLKIKGIPSSHIKMVIQEFIPILEEVNLIETNPDVKEAYRSWDKEEIKKYKNFLEGIIANCKRYSDNGKVSKVKKNKNPLKAHSSLKKIEAFQFKKEDTEFKLVSGNPLQILEVAEVWLYNTKYRFITHLVAEEGKSFEIKGTTIYNFDKTKSGCKYIRKNTKEKLDEVLNGTRVSLRKYFDSIKGDMAIITGRSNEHTILLRFFK